MIRLGSARAVWWALIALTVGSCVVIETNAVPALSTLLVVAIATLKVRLIILHFMEAKRAPRVWRVLYETWNYLVATIIIGGYLAAIAT